MKNTKIFRNGEKCIDFFKVVEKYKDFSQWSCCNERPAQVKNTKIFQSGEKCIDFSKWSC
jgi:hypothetical protein